MWLFLRRTERETLAPEFTALASWTLTTNRWGRGDGGGGGGGHLVQALPWLSLFVYHCFFRLLEVHIDQFWPLPRPLVSPLPLLQSLSLSWSQPWSLSWPLSWPLYDPCPHLSLDLGLDQTVEISTHSRELETQWLYAVLNFGSLLSRYQLASAGRGVVLKTQSVASMKKRSVCWEEGLWMCQEHKQNYAAGNLHSKHMTETEWNTGTVSC